MSTTTSGQVTRTIEATAPNQLQTLLGVHDAHLKMIVSAIPVRIISRSGKLLITGEPTEVEYATTVIEKMQDRTRFNLPLDEEHVKQTLEETLAVKFQQQTSSASTEFSDEKQAVLLEIFEDDGAASSEEHSESPSIHEEPISSISTTEETYKTEKPHLAEEVPKDDLDYITSFQKQIKKQKTMRTQETVSTETVSTETVSAETVSKKNTPAEKTPRQEKTLSTSEATIISTCSPMSKQPRSRGQAKYLQAIEQNDLVFCAGPAGSGKTYLAVAMALHCLQKEMVRKIVLVRPAVEAGEKLGFLPGDMLAKVNPFLRPLLDALQDMISYEQVQLYMEHDVIEIVPLAFMRGRTLNDTFMILDEAQNTTVTQMKMFLTRMGTGSKIIVTGDETQNDLPVHVRSGLTDAMKRLTDIEGATSVRLDGRDIVRHRLVREIVEAYDDQEKESNTL